MNQNHAETDSTDTQKGIEGYRRSFDSDVVNQKYQQAEHCGRITENVDDNALTALCFDELTIVCHSLFFILFSLAYENTLNVQFTAKNKKSRELIMLESFIKRE